MLGWLWIITAWIDLSVATPVVILVGRRIAARRHSRDGRVDAPPETA
jgi:hypothetical protein